MNRSAAASSSPVVTPGRTLPSSRRSVRTSTSPAAAILATSSGVLRMITGAPLDLFLEPERGEGRADVVVHLRRRARAVEPLEDPAVVVEVDEGLGLLAVGVEPLAHCLGLVVVALDELEAVDVADVLVLGLVELDVVDVAVLALAPAGQAADDLVVVGLDEQHRGQAAAEAVERVLERLGLADRAREAV